MQNSKKFFLMMFFFVCFIKADQTLLFERKEQYSGILPQELQNKIRPIKVVSLQSGETVVSTQTIVKKNEEGQDVEEEVSVTANDIIDEKISDSFFIRLSQEQKNAGSFSKENFYFRPLVQDVTKGLAVYCQYGDNIHVIVSDKQQPSSSICEELKYQILQLQLQKEKGLHLGKDNSLPASDNSGSYSGIALGGASIVSVAVGAAGTILVQSMKNK